MSTEENKAVVLRYFDERWNKQNFAVVDELCRDDGTNEEHKAWLEKTHAALGDIHLTADTMVAEDDQVALLFTLTAVHRGECDGVPPSGKTVTFQGMALLRIEDGQIVDDTAFPSLRQALLEQR